MRECIFPPSLTCFISRLDVTSLLICKLVWKLIDIPSTWFWITYTKCIQSVCRNDTWCNIQTWDGTKYRALAQEIIWLTDLHDGKENNIITCTNTAACPGVAGDSGSIKGEHLPPSWRLCPPPLAHQSEEQCGQNQPFLENFWIFAPSESHFAPSMPPTKKKILVPPLVGKCIVLQQSKLKKAVKQPFNLEQLSLC